MNEDDLTSRAREYETAQIQIGHVEGIYDKGNLDGLEGERNTLVYVVLGGKNQDQLSPASRGRRLCCALSSLAGGRIPKQGTRVIVAIPHGLSESPGAAVIIATIEDDPERLEEDRRVFDYGDEHVIIKAKSVTLESAEGEFISVGEPRSGGTSGIIVQAKDGSGAVWQVGVASMFVASDGDAKSLIQLTPNGAELVQKDTGFVRLKDGAITGLSNDPLTLVCPKFTAAANPASAVPALVVAPTALGFAPSLTTYITGAA
jgi:hypothetical protein